MECDGFVYFDEYHPTTQASEAFALQAFLDLQNKPYVAPQSRYRQNESIGLARTIKSSQDNVSTIDVYSVSASDATG